MIKPSPRTSSSEYVEYILSFSFFYLVGAMPLWSSVYSKNETTNLNSSCENVYSRNVDFVRPCKADQAGLRNISKDKESLDILKQYLFEGFLPLVKG